MYNDIGIKKCYYLNLDRKRLKQGIPAVTRVTFIVEYSVRNLNINYIDTNVAMYLTRVYWYLWP